MKKNKLKMITIIFLIILISMIAFGGVYVQVQNRMENKVKDYAFAMDLNGSRRVVLKVSEAKEEGSNNVPEILTVENYNTTKEIIENRLEKLAVGNYIVSVNEQTGEIEVTLTEDDKTDKVVSNLATVGKFEIIDTNTKEVLLSNKDIKTSNVQRSATTSGTNIYLTIEFNDEGKKKLEEITKTYIPQEENKDESTQNTVETETTKTEENTEKKESTKKTVTMKFDDEEMLSTDFEEPLTEGIIYLTVGQVSTNSSTIQDNINKALQMAAVLSYKNMPIEYEISSNTFIQSSITEESLQKLEIVVAIILGILLIVVIFKFKTKGLLASISYLGLASLFLLVIRYANVVLSIEGILAIILTLCINYIYTVKILNNIEKLKEDKKVDAKHAINQAIKDISIKIIPICILSIVFCFAGWVPTSSFGMVMFWGITLVLFYNLIITKNLLKYSLDK